MEGAHPNKRARLFLIEEEEDEAAERKKRFSKAVQDDCGDVERLLYEKLHGIKPKVDELGALQYKSIFYYGGGGWECDMETICDYMVEMAWSAYQRYWQDCRERRLAAALCLLRLVRIRDVRKLLVRYVIAAEQHEQATVGMLDFCCRNFIGRYHKDWFWNNIRVGELLKMAKKNG